MSKIAFVTGATSGIGKSLVLTLLKQDMIVIGLGRSDDKIDRLLIEVKPYVDQEKFYIIKGDLASHKGVLDIYEKTAKLLDDKKFSIDYMCHVAGRVTSGYHISQDHHELTFQVNHLAVVDLTHQLLPYMNKSLDSRILVVSSQSHFRANINFNDLETKTYYSILRSYKRSKLYNVLFVKGFNARFKEIPIFAIDPGLVRTEIGTKTDSKLVSFIWNWRVKKAMHPEVAARHMLEVIQKSEFNDLSGDYVKYGKSISSNPVTYQEEVVDRLWNETLKMLDIKDFFNKKS